MTRAEEIAWAAGLFEGEGCITKQPRRPHQPRLQLASTDRDVVEQFREVIGCGSISLMSRSERLTENPKPIWAWVAVSNSAVQVLHELLPYLGKRRSAKAREVIALREEHIAFATRERACEQCGTAFRPRWCSQSIHVKYCSPRCQARAAQELSGRISVPIPLCCHYCGEFFAPKRKGTFYCSKRCRDRMGKWNMRGRGAPPVDPFEPFIPLEVPA